jgi:hypothetical protein
MGRTGHRASGEEKSISEQPLDGSWRAQMYAAVGVASAGLLFRMSQADASDKMTRQQAQYQDTPNGIYSCGLLFERPNACKAVEGEVSRDGWCKAFALARVPGAMQRVAVAKRCFAEPGPYQTPALVTAPAQQRTTPRATRCAASGARVCASRPSRTCECMPIPALKTSLILLVSCPTEGRSRTSRTRGRMRWTRQRQALRGVTGRNLRGP